MQVISEETSNSDFCDWQTGSNQVCVSTWNALDQSCRQDIVTNCEDVQQFGVKNKEDNPCVLICKFCDISFKHSGELNEHMGICHMKGKVSCKQCHRIFPSRALLRTHSKEHCNTENKCPHCNCKLMSQTYGSHFPFCRYKGRQVSAENVIIVDINENELKQRTWHCKNCGQFFIHGQLLKDHDCKYTQTGVDSRNDFDNVVSVESTTPHDLRGSEALHQWNGKEQISFSCSVCHKILSKHETLETHLCKYICCPLCGFKTFDFTEINNHLKSFHAGSSVEISFSESQDCKGAKPEDHLLLQECGDVILSENSVLCKRCGVSIPKSMPWINHILECQQTAKMLKINEPKSTDFTVETQKFQCADCNKTFPTEIGYKIHYLNKKKLCPANKQSKPSIFVTPLYDIGVENMVKKIYTCLLCKKQFHELRDFRNHTVNRARLCSKAYLQMTFSAGKTFVKKCFRCGHTLPPQHTKSCCKFCSFSKDIVSRKCQSCGVFIRKNSSNSKCHVCSNLNQRIIKEENCERSTKTFKSNKKKKKIGVICLRCSGNFISLLKFIKHLGVSTSCMNKYPRLKCRWCKMNFKSSRAYLNHLSEQKGECTEKPGLECIVCKRFFKNEHSLRVHKNYCKVKREKSRKRRFRISCEVCGRTFFSNDFDILRRHEAYCRETYDVKSSHITSKKVVQSSLSSLTNVSQSYNKCSSELSVNTNSEKKLSILSFSEKDHEQTCIACCKQFKSKISLQVHQKNCTKKMQANSKSRFQIFCQFCEKSFLSVDFNDLRRHDLYCKGVFVNNSQFCKNCSKSFPTLKDLKNHEVKCSVYECYLAMSSQRSKSSSEELESPFAACSSKLVWCPKCGQRFEYLANHECNKFMEHAKSCKVVLQKLTSKEIKKYMNKKDISVSSDKSNVLENYAETVDDDLESCEINYEVVNGKSDKIFETFRGHEPLKICLKKKTLLQTQNKSQKIQYEIEQTDKKDLYSCKICKLKMKDRKNYLKHMIHHCDSITHRYQCPWCHIYFRWKYKLIQHQSECLSLWSINKSLTPKVDKGSCRPANSKKVLPYSQNMLITQDYQLKPDVEKTEKQSNKIYPPGDWSCNFCFRPFVSQNYIENHIKRAHPFVCTCGMVLTGKEALSHSQETFKKPNHIVYVSLIKQGTKDLDIIPFDHLKNEFKAFRCENCKINFLNEKTFFCHFDKFPLCKAAITQIDSFTSKMFSKYLLSGCVGDLRDISTKFSSTPEDFNHEQKLTEVQKTYDNQIFGNNPKFTFHQDSVFPATAVSSEIQNTFHFDGCITQTENNDVNLMSVSSEPQVVEDQDEIQNIFHPAGCITQTENNNVNLMSVSSEPQVVTDQDENQNTFHTDGCIEQTENNDVNLISVSSEIQVVENQDEIHNTFHPDGCIEQTENNDVNLIPVLVEIMPDEPSILPH
ncbi:zinc finger protein 729-like isoform X2 [Limulus polyphemus]|uniref:Zinc finger protein 729-like isoform X2 n=1 Tax=Limulus polyphemus TaxID=6850 RepID=A0ABM1SE35_LIMPO|nr:zinc finger protein 729-like isoform X2 [Limulus polyphemus]